MAAVLDQLRDWDVPNVAAAIVAADGVVEQFGDTARRFRLASLTKTFLGWATAIAVEEGTVHWATPAGQQGCTLRHLLAHAGGYPFNGAEPVSPPERTRIYSNSGIEIAAAAVADAAGMPFADYLSAAVFEPLGMTATTLEGSPAHGATSTASDVGRFLAELLTPRLLAAASATDVLSIQYPELAGIVPGVGKFDPCPWGLGIEIKGSKTPHWMSDDLAPTSFGHFGGAGTMLAVDPTRGVGVVALTDRSFDSWPEALTSWRALTASIAAAWG